MSSWSRCTTSDLTTIPFGNHGAEITVQRRAVPAFRLLAMVMVAHGYAIRPADTGAYNCRKIAGTSTWSNHAYGTAVDVNWQTNPYSSRLITDMPPEMIRDIEEIETAGGVQVFRWGGRYSGAKDAMHFEIMVSPEQLAQGLRGGTTNMPLNDADKNAIRDIVQNNREQVQETIQNAEARIKAEVEQEAKAIKRAVLDYHQAVIAVTTPTAQAAIRAKLLPATLAVINVVD